MDPDITVSNFVEYSICLQKVKGFSLKVKKLTFPPES